MKENMLALVGFSMVFIFLMTCVILAYDNDNRELESNERIFEIKAKHRCEK